MLLFTILVELRDRTCGYLVTLIHIYLLGIVTIDSKQYWSISARNGLYQSLVIDSKRYGFESVAIFKYR